MGASTTQAGDEPALVRGAGGSQAPWFEASGERLAVSPSLLERLDGDAAVTLVRAPAGFGKSTLVRLWRATREAPLEVLDLDEGEITDDLVDELLARTEGRLVVCARPGLTGLEARSRPLERLADAVVCIDGAELRLSDDQVADLWSGLGPTRTDALAPAVGGWARLMREVGAALAGRAARADGDPMALASHLAERLLAPWVEGLSSAERQVLAGLVRPVVLTADTAGVVLARPADECAALLDRLVRLGHLARDADGVHAWPAAVRTALRALVGVSDPEPDEILARWHVTHREHEAALQHALLRGDEELARTVLGHAWLPMNTYHHKALLAFFREVPDDWFSDPGDFPYRVRELTTVPPGETEQWVRRAPDPTIASHLRHDPRTALNLGLAQVFGLRRARRVAEAQDAARRLCSLAVQARADDLDEVADLLASTFLLTALVHELAGDLTEALEPLLWATETADVSANVGSARHASAHLAMVLAVLGRVEEAQRWLDAAATAPATTGWVTLRARMAVWVAEVLVATARDDRDAARAPLRALLTVRDPLDELWPFVLHARARYAALSGSGRDEVARLLAGPVAVPGSELDGILRSALDPR